LWPGQSAEDEAYISTQLRKFFKLCNGDLYLDRLHHYCRSCHHSRQEVVDEAVEILLALFVRSGIPIFMTTRWLKTGPGLKWFGRGLLLCNILRSALDRFSFLEEDKVKAPPKGKGKGKCAKGAAAAPAAAAAAAAAAAPPEPNELGIRLRKAREKLSDGYCRFYTGLSLYHLTLLDGLARVLFKVSTVTMRRASRSRGFVLGSVLLPMAH
jgi:hypothetical protein